MWSSGNVVNHLNWAQTACGPRGWDHWLCSEYVARKVQKKKQEFPRLSRCNGFPQWRVQPSFSYQNFHWNFCWKHSGYLGCKWQPVVLHIFYMRTNAQTSTPFGCCWSGTWNRWNYFKRLRLITQNSGSQPVFDETQELSDPVSGVPRRPRHTLSP